MDLLGFGIAVLLIELTPGPNMAWLAGLAALHGRGVGLAAVAGVALGLLINGVLAAVGLAALLQVAPGLRTALRIAGAAMMAWLAIKTWRGADGVMQQDRRGASVRAAFTTGALINLLNPKAYIFFLVVAPHFLSGATLRLGSALVLSILSVTIASTIHLAIVIAGARAHCWMTTARRTKVVSRLFAGLMLAVAGSFLWADLG